MTTPILMLLLMAGPYLFIRLLSAATRRGYNAEHTAVIGLTLLFIFTGMGHFIDTESMAEMMSAWVPERVLLVYLTGILEFAVAGGFLLEKPRRFTGWVAAGMLVLFFPVNVYAAINYIPIGGHAWGPVYLLIRAPLQALILLWIYLFVIRHPGCGERSTAGQSTKH